MRDHDVRRALWERLTWEHRAEAKDTLFLNELGLCGLARVDAAVVNGALSGYEIKSERDTLVRLPSQIDVYGRVLDYAFLVVASRHLVAANRLIPQWWGILIAAATPDRGVNLEMLREGTFNHLVEPSAVAELLWRDEALAIAKRYGIDEGIRTKTRDVVWKRLATELDLVVLRSEVRLALKARRGWQESRALRKNAETSPPSGTTPRFLARRLR